MALDSQLRVLQKICGDQVLKESLVELSAMELQLSEQTFSALDEELTMFERRFDKPSREE